RWPIDFGINGIFSICFMETGLFLMMTWHGYAQMGLYILIICVLMKPVGWYMAQVYTGQYNFFTKWMKPLENRFYKICRIDKKSMTWQQYTYALLLFNGLSIGLAYVLQRVQFYLPLNPQALPAPNHGVALQTAISFVTNTNWQVYSGEQTMSYLSQMLALTTQNFLSAATGLSVLMVFIRSLSANKNQGLGNYWVDMVRGVIYILLPFSFVLALALSAQGVIQNLKPSQSMVPLQSLTQHTNSQLIPMGPVASQIAIKQLGSNGGGFFNANGAHPFENPTPLTNILELLAILVIPVALTYTFGFMLKDLRQGRILGLAMLILWLPNIYFCLNAEQLGNPKIQALGIQGPNMEGKESRFGITNSVLWTMATTATANGATNSNLDSYTPLGGGIALWLMHCGEVIFGGVGSGLYGMLLMVIIAVFIGGLMVGRSPEYLGKKIEAFEIKMASMVILILPLLILFCTALAVVLPIGRKACTNPAMHGLTEILYGFTSMATNNGSAFAGLHAEQPFYLFLGGLVMLIGRYVPIVCVLALSGSLMAKQKMPSSIGTIQTHNMSFLILLIAIVLLIGALSFLPVLALGPIVEHLMFWNMYAS
ncbi:MAG TPA: potassium-transporting ATPase subunit KdpA, partial [Legionellaceae bacterium]|nr:potassium-transporting ATPase subunit KdpA [Legionellaceae bacterium]